MKHFQDETMPKMKIFVAETERFSLLIRATDEVHARSIIFHELHCKPTGIVRTCKLNDSLDPPVVSLNKKGDLDYLQYKSYPSL